MFHDEFMDTPPPLLRRVKLQLWQVVDKWMMFCDRVERWWYRSRFGRLIVMLLLVSLFCLPSHADPIYTPYSLTGFDYSFSGQINGQDYSATGMALVPYQGYNGIDLVVMMTDPQQLDTQPAAITSVSNVTDPPQGQPLYVELWYETCGCLYYNLVANGLDTGGYNFPNGHFMLTSFSISAAEPSTLLLLLSSLVAILALGVIILIMSGGKRAGPDPDTYGVGDPRGSVPDHSKEPPLPNKPAVPEGAPDHSKGEGYAEKC